MRIFSAILHSMVGKTITLFMRVDYTYIRLILYGRNDYDTKITKNDEKRAIHCKLQRGFTVRFELRGKRYAMSGLLVVKRMTRNTTSSRLSLTLFQSINQSIKILLSRDHNRKMSKKLGLRGSFSKCNNTYCQNTAFSTTCSMRFRKCAIFRKL